MLEERLGLDVAAGWAATAATTAALIPPTLVPQTISIALAARRERGDQDGERAGLVGAARAPAGQHESDLGHASSLARRASRAVWPGGQYVPGTARPRG